MPVRKADKTSAVGDKPVFAYIGSAPDLFSIDPREREKILRVGRV
jgi:hypothetical protein